MHNAVEHEMGSSHYNFDGFSCITARLEFHFKTILTVYCSQSRCQYILIQFFCDCDTYVNIFSIFFLLAANVDDADGSFLDFLFGGKNKKKYTEETNSDTGKNNHKLIIASIGNQVNLIKAC